MDVLSSFKVLPVLSGSAAFELLLDEIDRYVKEDVQIWLRKAEIAVFSVEYPVSELLGFFFILHLCTLVCYI